MISATLNASAIISIAASREDVAVSSTCTKDTQWSSKNVGKKLKEWLTSIRVDDSLPMLRVAAAVHQDGNRPWPLYAGKVDEDGYADGLWWMSGGKSDASLAESSGFFYGPMDVEGRISGDMAAFVYPDLYSAMLGRFAGSIMLAARATTIIAQRCKGGVKELRFAPPDESSAVMYYRKATHLAFSGSPTLVDPYERRTVFVRDLGDGRGQGLFAKRKIRAGETAAYYSGLVFNVTRDPIYHENQTSDEMFRVHKNVIAMTHDHHVLVNVPPDYWPLEKYRATLGHKVNHSFLRHNCHFNTVYHPRYGLVRGLEASRDIARGEELLVNYRYPLEEEGGPPPRWFYEAYMSEVGELSQKAKQIYEYHYARRSARKEL